MLLLIFVFLLFACGILVNKLLLGMIPPMLLVGLRMTIGGIILFFITFKKHRTKWSQLKKDALMLTGIALFTTYIPSILKAYALSRLGAGQATLLGSIEPFVTALYAYIIWRETLSKSQVLGITLGMIGMIISMNSTVQLYTCATSTLMPQLGALAAVFLSRIGWLMVQTQLRKDRYSPAELNSLIMTQSGSMALLSSFWIEPTSSWSIISPGYFALLLGFTIFVGNIIAYTLYGHILKAYNATLVSLAGFSIPVFTGLISWVFMGEKLTIRFFIAAVTIFVGLTIFYYDQMKARKRTLT